VSLRSFSIAAAGVVLTVEADGTAPLAPGTAGTWLEAGAAGTLASEEAAAVAPGCSPWTCAAVGAPNMLGFPLDFCQASQRNSKDIEKTTQRMVLWICMGSVNLDGGPAAGGGEPASACAPRW